MTLDDAHTILLNHMLGLGERTPFIVDGLEDPDPDSNYAADGQYPPFVIFDIEAQRNLEGKFLTREEAQMRADKLNPGVYEGRVRSACNLVEQEGDRRIARAFIEWCEENSADILEWDAEGNHIGNAANGNGPTP